MAHLWEAKTGPHFPLLTICAPLAMCLQISPTRKWSSFPYLFKPSWSCDLLWSIECGRSNIVSVWTSNFLSLPVSHAMRAEYAHPGGCKTRRLVEQSQINPVSYLKSKLCESQPRSSNLCWFAADFRGTSMSHPLWLTQINRTTPLIFTLMGKTKYLLLNSPEISGCLLLSIIVK